MAHISDDRVLESTTSTGTGALTLAGGLTGFKTFASSMSVGDTCWYALWAVDASGNATGDYEEGLGTYSSASTLTRTTVLKSSNANAVVTLAAGTKYVAIAALSSKILGIDNEAKSVLPVNAATATITTPSASAFYTRAWAGRSMFAFIGADGVEQLMQNHLASAKPGLWLPPGNATTVPGVTGLTAWTTTGTATARTVATTNKATRLKRLGYVSAATAGALAYQYSASAQFTCGTGTVLNGGGFLFVMQFVPSNAAAVSGERFFAGISSNVAAPTNVEPNTLTNTIGVAQLSTDATQLYLVYGGSAAQTAIALGATNFPGATLSTTAFEIAIFAPSSVANTYYVQITNLNTEAIYTNTLTGAATIVPQSTTLLAPRIWKTNNATLLAVGYDMVSTYLGSEC
jgi:hypothetical protein